MPKEDGGGGHIRVFCRIRPPLPREISKDGGFVRCLGMDPADGVSSVVVSTSGEPVLLNSGGEDTENVKHFSLDRIFQETVDTREVYEESEIAAMVQGAAAGVNATILAYGMTGSGKSHTILGSSDQGKKKVEEGVVHMAARDLFAAAATQKGGEISMYFLEVYGSALTDCLLLEEEREEQQEEDGGTSKALRVRQYPDGEVGVENLTRWVVTSVEDVQELLTLGVSRRRVASQKLNSTSSRSHAVITFHCDAAKVHVVDLAGSERVKESGVSGRGLAEARQINLSLFHLSRVVKAVNERAPVVPYKDDVLCFLLKDAIGGNCRTALLAMVSPAQRHASESAHTLRFAAGASMVVNQAKVNKGGGGGGGGGALDRPWALPPRRGKPSRAALAKASAKAAKALPWSAVTAGRSPQCPGGRVTIEITTEGEGGQQTQSSTKKTTTKQRLISALAFGDPASEKLAMCLHGYPSSAEDSFGDWLLPALVHAGFYVLALDFPGCGKSPGPAFGSTRSEFALERGGPADVVAGVLRALKRWRSVDVLVGSDWGGGVALAMASSARHKQLVGAVVAHLPSFHEEHNSLTKVACRTMLLWNKSDAFHSFAKFRPSIKNLKETLNASCSKKGSSRSSSNNNSNSNRTTKNKNKNNFVEYYAMRADEAAWSEASRERAIVEFLTGVDFLPAAQRVVERPKERGVATDGKAVVATQNVVFRNDPKLDQGKVTGTNAKNNRTAAEKAGAEVARMLRGGARKANEFDGLLQAVAFDPSSSKGRRARQLFADLPTLSPVTLGAGPAAASMLQRSGLWSAAAADAAARLSLLCAGAPRYFPGRRVLTPHGLGCLESWSREGSHGTARVRMLRDRAQGGGQEEEDDGGGDRGGDHDDDHDDGGGARRDVSWVPLEQILNLNQPHELPTRGGSGSIRHQVVLEDGLFCDYTSTVAKAKMCEIAASLSPVLEQIGAALSRLEDGGAGGSAVAALAGHAALLLDEARCECVRTVRRCLDITTFQRSEGGRDRDRARYCRDDAAKFAVRGEGHCHTVSSTMAAFLYPWSAILGVDLMYREDPGGHHQWLEFSVRPSMCSFTCDLYRDDSPKNNRDERKLAEPVADTYFWDGSGSGHPAQQPKRLGDRPIRAAPLEECDVAAALLVGCSSSSSSPSPSSSVVSNNALLASRRPKVVQTAINEHFQDALRFNRGGGSRAVVPEPEKWAMDSSENYTFGSFGTAREAVLRAIARAEGGRVSILDIGAGSGEFMCEARALCRDASIDCFTIIGVTGGSERFFAEEEEEEEDAAGLKGNHVFDFVRRCQLESPSTLLDAIRSSCGQEDPKFDLIVSSWAFRHFADPLGTLEPLLHMLSHPGAEVLINELWVPFTHTKSGDISNWDDPEAMISGMGLIAGGLKAPKYSIRWNLELQVVQSRHDDPNDDEGHNLVDVTTGHRTALRCTRLSNDSAEGSYFRFKDFVDFTGEVSGPQCSDSSRSVTSAALSGGACYAMARYCVRVPT